MTAAGSSSSAATASAQSPAAAGEGDGTAPSWKTRFFSLFQRGSDSDDEPEVEEDELPEEPPRDPEDEEQDALINQVKEMTGLWEIDPEDSTWLHLDCLDHETGIREPMGRVCYSMQLWPQDKAMIMKVGTGRSAPNQDPFLPPPTGRLQFSWNPFYMSAAYLSSLLPILFLIRTLPSLGVFRSVAHLYVQRSSAVSFVWEFWHSWSSVNLPSTF
jgi:hypothetical protein